jgi:O-antigen/teichoic acid export membrane protein
MKEPSESLLRSAVRNSASAGLGSIATFIIGFVFAGLTIRYLGEDRGGYLMSLQALVGVNSIIVGFGLGTPLVRRAAGFLAERNLAGIRRTVGTVITVNLVLGVLFAALLPLFFSQIFDWSKLPAAYREDALWATILTAASFAIMQAGSSWQLMYTATQRYDISTILSTVTGLASGGLGILVLRLMPSMRAIAGAGLLVVFLRLTVDAFMQRRLFGEIFLPAWEWIELKAMSGFGAWTYLGSMGGFLFTNVDRLLLTTFLGSASLPYYVIPQRLYSQVHVALSGQSEFLFPMLSSFGDKAASKIGKIEDRMRWFIAAGSILMYFSIAVLAPVVLEHLISREFVEKARWMILLACVQGLCHAQMIVPYFTSWSMGKGAPNTLAQLSNGVLVIGSAFLLIPSLGVLGMSIAQLWILPVFIVHSFYVRHLTAPASGKFFWARAYVSPGLMAGVWLALIVGAQLSFPPGSVAWTSVAMAGGLLGALVLWVVERDFLSEYDRLGTLQRALRLIVNRFKVVVRIP